MKKILLLCSLLFAVSISAKEVKPSAVSSVPVVKLQQNGSEFIKVKDSFSQKSPFQFVNSFLNFDVVSAEASDQGSKILSDYIDMAKVNDVFEFLDKNSDISGPLVRYIDPQDDLEVPIWQTVNHKLRNNLKLNEDERSFAKGLDESLAKLPKVEGITFRGASLTEEKLSKYFVGAEFPEKGFLSSTLDVKIANGFAKAQDPSRPTQVGRWSVIFIIKGESGRYISLFVPTNIHELEILFPTNTLFVVGRIVQDEKTKTATVWMSEK